MMAIVTTIVHMWTVYVMYVCIYVHLVEMVAEVVSNGWVIAVPLSR